jgi:hypothetical protein
MDKEEADAKFREMVARGGDDTLAAGALAAGFSIAGTRTGRLSSAHSHVSNLPKSNKKSCIGCEHIATQGGGQWRNGEPHYVGCPTELEDLRRECSALRKMFARVETLSLIPESPITGELTEDGFISADASSLYRSPQYNGPSTLSELLRNNSFNLGKPDPLVYETDKNGLVSFSSIDKEGSETLRMQLSEETFEQIKNWKPKRKERTIDLLRRLHGGTWVYNPSSMYPYTQTNTGRRVYFTSVIPQFEDGDSPREMGRHQRIR